MDSLDENFLKRLLKEDSEFKKIYEEHRDCGKMVSKLVKKNYLTREEEDLKKKLQKLKLTQKDRMEKIVSKLQTQDQKL